jgi:hypothetical protein
MSTIDDESLIKKLIENDGYYEGDPRVYQIVKYKNAWGNITWGVTWENEPHPHRYEFPTEYVNNPVVIWRQNNEHSRDGSRTTEDTD